jgi:hypothetical protein
MAPSYDVLSCSARGVGLELRAGKGWADNRPDLH